MSEAWKQYAADFSGMTDAEIEEETRQCRDQVDEAENWLEAVASWLLERAAEARANRIAVRNRLDTDYSPGADAEVKAATDAWFAVETELATAAVNALPDLLARIAALESALEQCRDQFQFYADEHSAAGKTEKAATNQRFADLAQAALTLNKDTPNAEG